MKLGGTWLRLGRSENTGEPSYLSSGFSCPCCCCYFSPPSGNESGGNTLLNSAAQQKCQVEKKWVNILSPSRAAPGRTTALRWSARARSIPRSDTLPGRLSVLSPRRRRTGSAPLLPCAAAGWDAAWCGTKGSEAERMRLEHRVFGQKTPEPDPTAFP